MKLICDCGAESILTFTGRTLKQIVKEVEPEGNIDLYVESQEYKPYILAIISCNNCNTKVYLEE